MDSSQIVNGAGENSASSHVPPDSTSQSNGTQFRAIAIPNVSHLTLHIQLNRLETSNTVFLTSSDAMSNSSMSALGSFVYAMPNRFQASEPLCTSLCIVTSNLEFATRVAKILARRTGKPTYVGCSVNLGVTNVEEEMGALKRAADTVMDMLKDTETATAS